AGVVGTFFSGYQMGTGGVEIYESTQNGSGRKAAEGLTDLLTGLGSTVVGIAGLTAGAARTGGVIAGAVVAAPFMAAGAAIGLVGDSIKSGLIGGMRTVNQGQVMTAQNYYFKKSWSQIGSDFKHVFTDLGETISTTIHNPYE